jgi:hypothetical protein
MGRSFFLRPYITTTSTMLQRHSIPRTLHCLYILFEATSTKRYFTSSLHQQCYNDENIGMSTVTCQHCSTFYSKNNQQSTKRSFTSPLLRRCDFWDEYSTISQHRSTFYSKNNQPTVCLHPQDIITVIYLHCFTLNS